VIEGVTTRLAERGLEMTVIHWRPNIVKKVADDGAVVTDPHAVTPRSYAQSIPKLALLFLDWWAGYLTLFRESRAAGKMVLSDRHYLDLLIDPVRYRFKGPAWLARLVFACIPNPTLLVLLDVPPDEIQRRKQEVTPEETARQVEAYRKLVARYRCGDIVDAARNPDEVAEAVTERILSSYRPPVE
jgi:thymidylate kinase